MPKPVKVLRKATQSVIWLFADSWLSLIWGIIYVGLMARLLGPEVYGVMALAAACLGVGAVFLGDTLTEGLQQFEKLDAGHSNVAFWLNLGLNVSYAAIVILIAGPVGRLFGSELLTQILPVLALISLFGSICDVPEALLERDLEHKKLVILEAITDIPISLLAIGLAFLGFGVWALIIPAGVTTFIWTIAIVWITKWRPTLSVSKHHWRDVISFARDTFFTKCLGYLDGALPTIALGYFLGERALGLYSIAMNVAGQLSGLLMGPLSEIAMTVVARLQSDLKQVRKLLNDVFHLTTFVMYPAIIGACLVVPLIVPLVLGDQWLGIELPLVIALLLGLRHATGDFNIAILRGLGDTRSPLISLSAGVLILAVFLPVAAGYGVVGVVSLVALRVFATWPLSAWFVQRRSGYPALAQFTTGWRAAICSLAMAGCVLAFLSVPVISNFPALLQLGLAIGLGVAAYLALYGLIWTARLRAGLNELKAVMFGSPESFDDEPDYTLATP